MSLSHVTPPGQSQSKYDRLIARAQKVQPAKTVVVHPCDETSLKGASDAAHSGLIIPILVGPSRKIKDVAREYKVDIGSFEIIEAEHSEGAAAEAVQLIREAKG